MTCYFNKIKNKLIKRISNATISQDEWFRVVCASYNKPPVFLDNAELPGFPPDDIQKNTTGQAGVNTLEEAFIFYQDCVKAFALLNKPIQRYHHLLDFGVGWGRIARFFLRELPLSNIHGIDVMREFVDICKETFKSDNFHVTSPFPPSTMKTGSFDFIIGYSVFSHLSERACREWMQEFHRITTPGGLLALTTRGRHFFDYCESLKGNNLDGYSGALAIMFNDFNEARKRYDQGEFVHSNAKGVTGGKAMTAEFYGETFIPEQYARNAYRDMFTLERFIFDPARQTHPIMVFKRR
jgi:2-polyprenyl-3-methyl-5-hydroxy-6-metoxy-1,4-benzoquinol methylase